MFFIYILTDPPGKPGQPKILDWDEHHVDLSWTAPDSDGGSPISGYMVGKKDKFSVSWTKALTVPSNVLKGRINGLDSGTEYQFRVIAVNKAGPGEPSQASHPILVKARYGKLLHKFLSAF